MRPRITGKNEELSQVIIMSVHIGFFVIGRHERGMGRRSLKSNPHWLLLGGLPAACAGHLGFIPFPSNRQHRRRLANGDCVASLVEERKARLCRFPPGPVSVYAVGGGAPSPSPKIRILFTGLCGRLVLAEGSFFGGSCDPLSDVGRLREFDK